MDGGAGGVPGARCVICGGNAKAPGTPAGTTVPEAFLFERKGEFLCHEYGLGV